MKYVLIQHEIAHEIISELPDVPMNERFSPDFLRSCVLVSDDAEVTIGHKYDPLTGRFYPINEERQTIEQSITDLELTQIELGQQITDIELMVLGGQNNV